MRSARLNLLEATRKHAPEAVFIFTSTNKVYGDLPNRLPLVEQELRFEIDPGHPYAAGIPEDMSIDQSMHSVFGASKVAADVLVQEYGRYFGLRTVCFRGGCLTGPEPRGHTAPWLSLVPDEVRDDWDALHGVRLQGKAGPGQHPQRRPDCRVPRILCCSLAPGRSTTSAAAASATVRCWRRSRSARS